MTRPSGFRLRHRTLPIRRWLLLALLATIMVPLVVTAVVGLTHFYPTLHAQDQAPSLLRKGARHWTDPAWQRATRAHLARYGIDFVLIEQGHEVYRTTPDPLAGADVPHDRTVQRLVLAAGRQMAYIYWGGPG